jgi:hypothetical protein
MKQKPIDICEYVIDGLVKKGKLPKFVGFMSMSAEPVHGYYELELFDSQVDEFVMKVEMQYKSAGQQVPPTVNFQRICRVTLDETIFTDEDWVLDAKYGIYQNIPVEAKAAMRVAYTVMKDYKTWRKNYWSKVN